MFLLQVEDEDGVYYSTISETPVRFNVSVMLVSKMFFTPRLNLTESFHSAPHFIRLEFKLKILTFLVVSNPPLFGVCFSTLRGGNQHHILMIIFLIYII